MDMISELPDDILVQVLSSLSLKEFGRASVLSKFWRHLWVHNPTLNFGYPNIIKFENYIYYEVRKGHYLSMVDKVVNSHKAPTIDEFSVCIDITLLDGASNSIDTWFRFAMKRRVKRLQIDLFQRETKWYKPPGRHTFPRVSLCNTLTSLKLGCINIDSQTLECFLCDCQALECLSVKYSDTLVHLKVSGPSLKLKHLTIYSSKLKQFEVFAPNLESFCYYGPVLNVQFKSAPKLARVHIGGSYSAGLTNMCSDLSSYLSQIELLKIHEMFIRDYYCRKDAVLLESLESIIFTRLRKLDVMCDFGGNDDLYCFTCVIKACPRLHHFRLQLRTNLFEGLDDLVDEYWKKRKQKKWKGCRHFHLEILEIVGFVGYPIDLEFAVYIIENAPFLSKIIAHTYMTDSSFDFFERRRLAMERAELLRVNMNPRTKLVIA